MRIFHDELADRRWWCHGSGSPKMAPGRYGAAFSLILLWPEGCDRFGELFLFFIFYSKHYNQI
jgi:hypothetical protein